MNLHCTIPNFNFLRHQIDIKIISGREVNIDIYFERQQIDKIDKQVCEDMKESLTNFFQLALTNVDHSC